MVNPGTALTNAAITTQGSIGHVTVTGNQLNSEIKTGFDYQSYLAGLEGTREASRIARLTQRGDLVSSVDSATFRPAKNTPRASTFTAPPPVPRGRARSPAPAQPVWDMALTRHPIPR